jgi:hypothetical protein
MTRWKRVGLSFASAIAAELLVCLAVFWWNNHSAQWLGFLGFMSFTSVLVVPGWLLALPFLIFLKRTDAWHLGLMALIGVLIGPFIVLGLDVWSWLSSPTSLFTIFVPWLYMATAISAVATAFYLTSLKLFSRPTQTLSS